MILPYSTCKMYTSINFYYQEVSVQYLQLIIVNNLYSMGADQSKTKFQQFTKRYKTKKFLKEGLFSRVYLVQDTTNNKLKAQKVLKQHLTPEEQTNVLTQVKNMIKINHIHILKTYDFAIEKKIDQKDKAIKRQYLHVIIQYINGGQLTENLERIKKKEIIMIYKQIKSAILYLQSQNIKSRQLSLDNIFIDMIDNKINVKITDFGVLNEIKHWINKRNPKRKIQNYYQPPENTSQTTTLNKDLWALGIILIQLSLGLDIKTLNSNLVPGQDPTFPDEFLKKYEIDPQIKDIIVPLLKKNVSQRCFYNELKQTIYENPKEASKLAKQNKIVKFKFIQIDQQITRDTTELDLTNNRIKKEGAIQISNNLKKLTYLNLARGDICKEGAISIAQNLSNLVQLNLAFNNIGKEGAIQIANNLVNLNRLKMQNNNIGKQGAVEIASKLKLLVQLDLSNNRIGKDGAIAIALNLLNLIDLILNNNNIGKDGAIQISKNLSNLKLLQLNDNNICKEGAIQIAKNLVHLKHLSLAYNNIGNEAAIEIAKNLIHLTELNLGYNNIQKQGAIQITMQLTQLLDLRLTHNQIEEGQKLAIKKLRNGRPIDI